MFTNVVIGTDGRQGGRDAVALAWMLAAPGATITVAHVWREIDTSPLDSAYELPVREVHAPSVAAGLHDLALELGADLVVVGSCRRTRVDRIRHGDDTRATLGLAPCHVAIAPAGYAGVIPQLSTIGVGYDGHEGADAALRTARRIAADRPGRILVFQALELPAYAVLAGVMSAGDALSDTVEAAHERLAALGDVEAHAAYGVPAEELEQFSTTVDLLVLGTNHRGRLARAAHGSTARALARTAYCPLLVVDGERELAVQAAQLPATPVTA